MHIVNPIGSSVFLSRLIFLAFGCLVGCAEDGSKGEPNMEASRAQAELRVLHTCEQSSRGKRPPAYCAEIRRTSLGVPHIKADNEKGLGYGIGYAFAEDNFCLLAEFIVSVNGERSKYFGASGSYDPKNEGSIYKLNNLSSDFYFKYLNDPALVLTTWERQPTEVKDLVRGYVAGFNRYLREVGRDGLPDACNHQPWVREITELDLMRLMRRLAIEYSGGLIIEALYAAEPPSGTNKATSSTSSRAIGHAPGYASRLDAYFKRSAPRAGSNGVALGASATESGAGLLLANPHLAWKTAFRFYQMHLTIPGKVDVMGASLSGFPGINLGFNQNVAWTHTDNTSSHFTLYALQLDPADPTRYVVDGRTKSMIRKELSVEVAGADGTTSVARHTYYFSDYGPLIKNSAFQWTGDTAYAFADANFDNDRMFRQWWTIDKAASLAEFKHSVETIVGIPWSHAIATDKFGSVYYADVTPVPNVSNLDIDACVAAPYQPLVTMGLYVLNGNNSACRWSNDAAAPQRGILSAAKLPSMLRTDFVQNSNESAWLTNPAQLLTGFPPIVSIDSYEQNGRTRIGLAQIAARLAGTDGLPGNKFSLESLQSIAFSNRSMYAGVLLADLNTACVGAGVVALNDGSQVDIGKGCDVMANWDGTANLDSIGWPLFLAWRQTLNASGIDYWNVPFDAADPVNTPRGLRLTDTAVRTAARAALATAMKALDKAGLDYTRPWGQIQVAVRGSERIPIHGGDGDEIYNIIANAPIGDGQFDAITGSSAVWTISFEGDSPKAQGFLTYSQSTNPKSPHYADQTRRFSDKDWITFPFTEAAIKADPNYSTKFVAED
jgi:acyl-homoserine-lactone acylase